MIDSEKKHIEKEVFLEDLAMKGDIAFVAQYQQIKKVKWRALNNIDVLSSTQIDLFSK